MEASQTQLLKKYLDLLVRRKGILISALLISAAIGLGYYLSMPKVYQSTSLLSYQQQSINPNAMSPDIEDRIRDIVSTLTQIVTSRTHLENLIKAQHLYTDALENLPMEDVIASMREQITITPSRVGDTFVVSYTGLDPAKVVKVTNALAAKFVEENLKYREERASETSAYTGDELLMAKEVLDKTEATMRDYKLENFNEMPEQRISNVSQLISMQGQYQLRQENIQDLERTKILIQEQINVRQDALSNQVVILTTQETANNRSVVSAENNIIQNLQNAKAQRDRLLSKYTEKHPDIKRLDRMIKGMEKEIGSITNTKTGESGTGTTPVIQDPTLTDLKLQLKEISLNVKANNDEKRALAKKVEQLEKWIAASPVREAEWSALTREYGELKRHYDYLVSQNLQAKSALHLERRQKGSQFKIEDPARFPETPFAPNFKKILAASLVVGVGLAAGLIFVFDFLDPSFRVGAEIEKSLGVPIICTIPYVETGYEIKKRRVISVLAYLVLAAATSGLCFALFYFWKEGHIII